MHVTKAVITAAAPDQHTLPLQRIVDRDGIQKSALELILAETTAAGINETCIIISPGDSEAFRRSAGRQGGQLTFIEQADPQGYADAVFRARDFVGNSPFLHLVGDHLYLSQTDRPCARQLLDVALAESCAVSAVQPTRENKLPYFGTVGARRVPRRSDLYEVKLVVEKPTPTEAEQSLVVAGLRAGYYLCLFGMHVITPTLMDILDELFTGNNDRGQVHLSDALSQLAQRERYLALQVDGTRYNIGIQYGLLYAQLALGLSGQDRDQILTELVELLASK